MLAKDYYPNQFHKINIKGEVDKETIKKWITFVEKSEYGLTVGGGNVLVFKNKAGDIIVTDSYRVLPKEVYDELQREGEQLVKEVEDFLNEKKGGCKRFCRTLMS